MARGLMFTGLLALAACQTAAAPGAPLFEVGKLAPTAEGEDITLKGWIKLGDGFRLYPSREHLGDDAKGACVSGVFLSTAGIPPPEYDGKEVVLTGHILRAGEPGASSLPDACGSGLDFQVSDLSLP